MKQRKIFTWLLRATIGYFALGYAVAIYHSNYFSKRKCMPPEWYGKLHDDYTIPFLKRIPYSVTTACLVEPPVIIVGNQSENHFAPILGAQYPVAKKDLGPKPYPRYSEMQFTFVQVEKGLPFWLPYFAVTGPRPLAFSRRFPIKNHFSIGTRWDDQCHCFVIFRIAWQYAW